MRITIISQSGNGSGLDENAMVADGSTVETVVKMAVGQDATSDRWVARVNGASARFSDALKDGDRLTITAAKVGGA